MKQLQAKEAELRKELGATRQKGAEQVSKAQKAAQDIAVEATVKVRNAEDEVENLQAELAKTKSQLAAIGEEETKAKDNALREADEALAASHRVDELNSKLAEQSKAAEKARA